MEVTSRTEVSVLENASKINLRKSKELEFLQTKLEEELSRGCR